MADNTTNITPPRVPFLDSRNGQVSREWYRFFLNLFTNTGGGTGITPIANGGTNSTSTPQAGAVAYGDGQSYRFTTVGTAGQFLTSNGAGAPAWAATGTVTSVDVSGGATGLTTSGGPITISGTVTLGGVLIAGNGGTGFSTYTVGDILYASTTTDLAKLADVSTGNALISGGVGVAPSWGKIGLGTHVTGTLPIANGGTGQITANAALNALLPSQTANAGKVLSTNGTDTSWINGGSSGGYTPTLTNSTNVAASTTGGCQYLQVGSVVTVSGQLSVDPTAASTDTVIYISLPIASNFTSSRNAAGSAASIQNIYGEVGGILGDTVNDRFELRLFPTSTANQSYSFHATYFVQ